MPLGLIVTIVVLVALLIAVLVIIGVADAKGRGKKRYIIKDLGNGVYEITPPFWTFRYRPHITMGIVELSMKATISSISEGSYWRGTRIVTTIPKQEGKR